MISIKIKKRSQASILIFLLIIFNFRMFYIVPFPVEASIMMYITWIAAVGMYFCYTRRRGVVRDYGAFLRPYFTYVLVAQLFICIYSMIVYEETVLDMFICAGSYFMLLMTYVVIRLFEREGMDYILNRIFWIQFIYAFFVIIHAVVFNNTGETLFLFDSDTLRNGNVRIYLGVFIGLYFIYTFNNWLQGERRIFMIIAMAIGIFGMFYVDMTRAVQLAVIGTCGCMWLFNKERSKTSIIRFITAIVAVVILVTLGVFDNIFNILSVDESVNSLASSTLARYNAMEYFGQFTRENPLIGMGWVRPYTDELTKIWSGPTGAAYLDDLGMLGQFYRQGILGIVIYVALIVRMGYIVFKVKGKCNERTLLIGVFSYILFTIPSLNCFDSQRMLVFPFYLAIFEYIYFNVQKSEQLVES